MAAESADQPAAGAFGTIARRLWPWLALALAIALLDQATKFWVESVFQRGERLPVTGFFNLVLVYNTGAAFSFLSDAPGWQRWALIAVSLVAVVFIGSLLARESTRGWFRIALVLILGGALGNLWDRIVAGEVVDFLDFYIANWHWPAFNLADSAITVGATILVIDSLFGKNHD